MPDHITFEGCTSQISVRWVCADQNGRKAWFPYSLCNGVSTAAVRATMAAQGIHVVGKAALENMESDLAGITNFPLSFIIERSGHSGGHIALEDGTIYSPPRGATGTATFIVSHGSGATSGTLAEWKKFVAKPVVGQSLPMFVIALAFAPLLLDLTDGEASPGFELIGKRGCGKAFLQGLAASVVGPPSAHIRDWSATIDAIGAGRSLVSDMPLILSGADRCFAGDSPGKRASNFKLFAANVTPPLKGQRLAPGEASRLIYLSASTASLAQMLGEGTDLAEAAAGMMNTIPVPDRRLGVFRKLPKEYESASAFAQQISKACYKYFGTAIREFAERLVADRAFDESALREKISDRIDKFVVHVGVDTNNLAETRDLRTFGLVYAASWLGQQYGILPKAYANGSPAASCYRMMEIGRKKETFVARIERLGSWWGTKIEKLADSTPEEIKRCGVIVKKSKGYISVWIRESVMLEKFPDWVGFRASKAVQDIIVAEKGKYYTKRRVRKDLPAEKFFVFRIPR